MRKILSTLLFLAFSTLSWAQQVQSSKTSSYDEDFAYTYILATDTYFLNFDTKNKKIGDGLKIGKANLEFSIQSTEKDDKDKEYYIIKFFPIDDESKDVLKKRFGIPYQTIKSTERLKSLKTNGMFISSEHNEQYFAVYKSDFESKVKEGYILKQFKTALQKGARRFNYGVNASIPFKLRSRINGLNRTIDPELTLGGFLGYKVRVAKYKPYYINPIVTAGLSNLTVNDNTNPTAKGSGNVLGVTGSVGVVFQLKDFQFGILKGWDYAAGEIAKDWIHNAKPWYAFSIGYAFLSNTVPTSK